MCRISLTYGSIFGESSINRLKESQVNGSDVKPEVYRNGMFTLVTSRFAVTSDKMPWGTYPLKSDRYVIAYNGEVFAYRDELAADGFESDVHFALEKIEEDGLFTFFAEADIQGTFFVLDKECEEVYVFVDQLNTCGCFYAVINGEVIVSQEHAIIHYELNELGVDPNTPIHMVENGTLLKISKTSLATENYRDFYKKVWRGSTKTASQSFDILDDKSILEFNAIMRKAVVNRIPRRGCVALLCSGGIDSSIIFHHTYEYLKERDEVDRLKVFTLGNDDLPLTGEENDYENVKYLLRSYGLDLTKHLEQIPVDWAKHWDRYEFLLRNFVFHSHPRLITPNPAQTQIRHTLQMSCVLASIVDRYPLVKTVLTGDFADEIFGGYNSMHDGVNDTSELVSRITRKLNDLPLNDASRVVLASLFGCRSVIYEYKVKSYIQGRSMFAMDMEAEQKSRQGLAEFWQKHTENDEILEVLDKFHPLEVRTPFSSHQVLNHVTKMHHSLLVGSINGRQYSKFFLRLCGLSLGIDEKICLRKKVPFSEGGTGVRNGESFSIEMKQAKKQFHKREMVELLKPHLSDLRTLGILKEKDSEKELNKKSFDVLAFAISASRAGLQRLMNGNVFGSEVPESNYSTEGEISYAHTFINLSTRDGNGEPTQIQNIHAPETADLYSAVYGA